VYLAASMDVAAGAGVPFVQCKRPLQFVSLYKGGPRNGGGVSRACRRASASAGCAIVIPLFLDSAGAARPKSEPGADLIHAARRIASDEINRSRPKRKSGAARGGERRRRAVSPFRSRLPSYSTGRDNRDEVTRNERAGTYAISRYAVSDSLIFL